MRILLIFGVAVVPAIAQSPPVQATTTVRLTNATRPASRDFQIGDRFEIVITGAANQPVSVRTTMQGGMDWSPVIGWTDTSGRWSTTGQFERADFGGWSEAWTAGGKRANPDLHFSVGAPCLKEGQGFMMQSGPNIVLTCDTAEGRQTFATPSDSELFRTPDGRLVPGRAPSNMTAEQYHAEIMQYLITSRANEAGSGQFGDEAGVLIGKIIGTNALNDDETRNVLAIIRAAFEEPDRIPQTAKDPSSTLSLLRNLADETSLESLKQQIAETAAYVQAR